MTEFNYRFAPFRKKLRSSFPIIHKVYYGNIRLSGFQMHSVWTPQFKMLMQKELLSGFPQIPNVPAALRIFGQGNKLIGFCTFTLRMWVPDPN